MANGDFASERGIKSFDAIMAGPVREMDFLLEKRIENVRAGRRCSRSARRIHRWPRKKSTERHSTRLAPLLPFSQVVISLEKIAQLTSNPLPGFLWLPL